MAEIRKHQPDSGDGLGDLVRRALGESIRPTTPGKPLAPGDPGPGDGGAADEEAPRPDTLPHWDTDGPTFTF
ncbi:MAG: hypothetical protein ABIS84_10545 [Arachnia sp.]